MSSSLDLLPLTDPLPASDRRQWEERYRSRAVGGAPLPKRGGGVGVFGARGLTVGSAGVVLGLALLLTPSPVAVGAAIAIVSGFVVATTIVLMSARRHPWERWARIDRFALANGMRFSSEDPVPAAYGGMVFGQGWDRMVEEHLYSYSPDGTSAFEPTFDLGIVRWFQGDRRDPLVRRWGFVTLQLNRRLPHLLLESTANVGAFGVSDLPERPARAQVLHLEGDFDRSFTLYCPEGYETDALYVFTPDLMVVLMDEAGGWNVEIVDDRVYLFRPGGLDLADPSVIAKTFRTLDLVGAKVLRQTARYTDDRVSSAAAGVVAPQGRRLRNGVALGTAVMIGVLVLAWTLPLIFHR